MRHNSVRSIKTNLHHGFSMIETLVALIIFAIGFLGFIGMQNRSVQMNVEMDQREQASRILNYMIEAIQTNRDAKGCYVTIGGVHASPYAGTGTSGSFSCSAFGTLETQTQANDDLNFWDDLLKGENQGGALISARGCVSEDTTAGTMTVSVVWQGLVDTVNSDDPCASTLYSADSRRVLNYTIAFANLENTGT
ncbi:type IV pilus modification protein PilV [Litoribrevibacter euphylliae]|uniref:Type IV pilus modification protein PilV n=1 Tax=Litoribrevibacter euphylliae TaxID=1834034 RepID=A0ABV7HGE0_9GAMM